MNKFRQGRINEEARKVLSEIMRTVKDPRVSMSFVTITSVDITRDMKFGKVYFSCLDNDPKEVKKGLYSAQGFIRSSLAKMLDLRITPELSFEYDDSAERGARIESILNSLNINKDEKSDD